MKLMQGQFLSFLGLLLWLCSWTTLQAQIIGPPDILLRNVTLIDPSGEAEDKVVNILLRQGKLELITGDKISSKEAGQVIDAAGGFIVGRLELGKQPSFIIFSEDPRTNFEIMLDTKTHSRFAIHKGIVTKNSFGEPVYDDPSNEPQKSGWLAYTPPPFAVPLNYADTNKWNRFETKWVSGIVTGALALDRMKWLSQNDASMAQVGDLNDYDGGEIRALRFGIFGTLNFEKPWIYTIAGATNAQLRTTESRKTPAERNLLTLIRE